MDADGDGNPDECDLCPGFNDNLDSDFDGVPDGCDRCPGAPDFVDDNNNGIPDACECDFLPVVFINLPFWPAERTISDLIIRLDQLCSR